MSHFLYLTWNASVDKRVTLMELEMQAEVDKYISTFFLLRNQQCKQVPAEIHDRLFERPIFDEQLDETGLIRYQEANFFAGKYCWQLAKQLQSRRRFRIVFEELRHFYKLTQGEKIHRIETRAPLNSVGI